MCITSAYSDGQHTFRRRKNKTPPLGAERRGGVALGRGHFAVKTRQVFAGFVGKGSCDPLRPTLRHLGRGSASLPPAYA